MSERREDDSPDSDPLLLFATEPATVDLPATSPEISKKIEPSSPPPEVAALLHRAETAERSLRESKREVAALKRQMATLVTVATDNRRPSRPVVALGLAAAALIAVFTLAWRYEVPAAAPPVVISALAPSPASTPPPAAAPEPMPEQQALEPPVTAFEQPKAIVSPTPYATVATTRPLPVRRVPVRSPEQVEPEPRREYVGTLSVDAVPAGGEVFINRKSVGRTPVLLPGLRAGSHLVWIQREGYRLFTRVVLVPADKVSRVSVALEPINPAPVRP